MIVNEKGNEMRKAGLFAALLIGGMVSITAAEAKDVQTAIFAGGCFWCVESDFESVKGVIEVTLGYTGGKTKNPTYKTVTKGKSGHYESASITFDADVVSYRKLVDLFWRSIDPTDADGQFCDRGSSYRSAIFTLNNQQKKTAAASKAAVDASGKLPDKIVTPIIKASTFYPAEEYHQNYYKGGKSTLTRFGYIKQSDAYWRYRKGCGRDARVKHLWGNEAPFTR